MTWGPLAAALVYVGAWTVGLMLPVPDLGDSTTQDSAVIVLASSLVVSIIQATLVHGIAGVSLYLFATRMVTRLRLDDTRRGRGVRVIAAVAAGLSLAQFAALLGAAASVADPGLAGTLLSLIDQLDVVKLLVLAALVITVSLTLVAVTGRSRWLTPVAFAVAALLCAGASAFIIPTDPTTLALGASLVLLLAWSVTTAALVTGRRGRRHPVGRV